MHKNEKIVSFFRSCCPVMPYAVLCVLDAPRRSAYSMLSCALCCLMHPDGQHTRMSYAVLCTQTVSILYYAPWQVACLTLLLSLLSLSNYRLLSGLSLSIPTIQFYPLLSWQSPLIRIIPTICFLYLLAIHFYPFDIINYAMGWFRIDRVVLSRPFWCHHDDTRKVGIGQPCLS